MKLVFIELSFKILDFMSFSDEDLSLYRSINSSKSLWLKKSGFLLDEGVFYNNKILTIVLDDIRDCFYVMDVLDSYDSSPYVQIYSEGKLLTDNLENLRHEITN